MWVYYFFFSSFIKSHGFGKAAIWQRSTIIRNVYYLFCLFFLSLGIRLDLAIDLITADPRLLPTLSLFPSPITRLVLGNEGVMAAAEARAAWQRAANRCLVQEDAKRAPKLACCPSSSAQQHHINNGNTSNAQDYVIPSFMHLNWKPVSSNLPPETRWWLQLQPNFRYQKDFTCEHRDFLDDKKMESAEFNLYEEPISDTILDPPWMVSTAFMNHSSEKKVETMKCVPSYSQNPQIHRVDMRNHHYKDDKPMYCDPMDPFISNKTEKASLEMVTTWTRSNDCDPWWRIADKNELASLVAQKSLEHVENCDLPRPTKTIHFHIDTLSDFEVIHDNMTFPSSSGKKLRPGFCDHIDYIEGDHKSGSINEKKWSSGGEDWLLHDDEILYSGPQVYVKTENAPPASEMTYEIEPSRAELLEALCHSQTRARKAEIEAQKANDEKDHIIKLLFRQASHLFAYKQWLQILQLESLCLQFKINEEQITTLFPVLPWMPLKDKSYVRDRKSPVMRKGKKQKSNMCKYAVFFAVGLGIAGAGLLLGWTLGWLLANL